MNALRLTLIASLLAFASAHAAGDEMPVETIVVTAKRPAFVESGETILVVRVTAPKRVFPDVVTVSPEDSVVIEAPKPLPVIGAPRLGAPQLSIAPPRNALALAVPAQMQG